MERLERLKTRKLAEELKVQEAVAKNLETDNSRVNQKLLPLDRIRDPRLYSPDLDYKSAKTPDKRTSLSPESKKAESPKIHAKLPQYPEKALNIFPVDFIHSPAPIPF